MKKMKKMKKIIFLIAITIFCNYGINNFVQAEEQESEKIPVIEAQIEFEWINMEQVKRDEKINQYREIIFANESTERIKRKEFRNTYKDFLKDKEFKTHYRLITNDVKDTKEYNMAGFFSTFRGERILYMYGLQPKNDLRHAYYYNALGRLSYVDDMSENYPNYPYYSKQYRSNGKLAGVIYFESKDIQYTYAPDSKFKGVWYKDTMYDSKGKKLLTRTNW
jgi:hypothetical protein